MENKKPHNPQAFPQEWIQNGTTDNWENGMTLRDYFANSAMLGILNNGVTINDEKKIIEAYEAVAFNSYLLADAMLKQREL